MYRKNQNHLKISIIPILLTLIYLVALYLLVNNQLNSSLRHIIVTQVLQGVLHIMSDRNHSIFVLRAQGFH